MNMPLIDIALKGSVLLLLAAALTRSLRGTTAASQRHFIWTLVLAGTLAIPAFSALPLRLAVIPVQSANRQIVESPTTAVETSNRQRVEAPEAMSGASSVSTIERFDVSTFSNWSIEQILLAAWIAGVAILLARIVASFAAALWLLKGSRELLDQRWQLALAQAADHLGVIAPVRLLESSRTRIPMTFGMHRPVILLPEESYGWHDEARRVVLLHELAHVRRGDMITNLLGQIACALYWFNPLVWGAARRLRIEAEQACDDMVLHAGAAPSAYAEQLLTIVQAAGRSGAPAIALPMAQPSAFEGRIIAILQPGIARHALSRRAVALGVTLLLAIALPLAALAPKAMTGTPMTEDRKGPASQDSIVASQDSSVSGARSPGIGPRSSVIGPRSPVSDSIAIPAGGTVSIGLMNALEDADEQVRVAAAHALGGRADTAAINALLEALRRDTSKEVRRMAAWALGEIEDARAVPGLVVALREERERDVRLAIVHALGEIESPDAVSGLGAALRGSSDAEIRRQIVWALGEIESPDAVPFLTGLLRDDDAEMRRQAAWALGEIESGDAVDELAAAFASERAEAVKEQIVWALGEIEDSRAAPALESALRDPSVVIRRKAAWALGEIDGIRSAPPGLIAALRDPDVEVRRAAAHALGELQDVAAVPGLVALIRDPDLDLRRTVVNALGEMRSSQAAQALVALLQDEDPEIRRLAAHALGNR